MTHNIKQKKRMTHNIMRERQQITLKLWRDSLYVASVKMSNSSSLMLFYSLSYMVTKLKHIFFLTSHASKSKLKLIRNSSRLLISIITTTNNYKICYYSQR